MPELTRVDLSRYRLEKAEEMLVTAKRDVEARDYASANNRAYYSIFHGMRAILALDGIDFKKHSAVIAQFTQLYLKTEIVPRSFSKVITNAALIRTKSDYEDFFICSREDTMRVVEGAESFLGAIKRYLDSAYQSSVAGQ